MSYTAQLLERLNRDAGFVATPYYANGANQNASSLSGSQLAPFASTPAAAVYRPTESPAPSRPAVGASANRQYAYLLSSHELDLPSTVFECHSIISQQRGDIAQLTSRLSSLDDTVTQLQNARSAAATVEADHFACKRRETSLQSQLNERDAALAGKQGEIDQLQRQLQGQAQELQQLQDEKLRLSQQLLDTARKVEEVRAAAERDKAELAFRLGRQAATAALAATVTASMHSEGTSPSRDSRHGAVHGEHVTSPVTKTVGAAATLHSPVLVHAQAPLEAAIRAQAEGVADAHGFDAHSSAASSPRYTTLSHSGEEAASVAPEHVVGDDVGTHAPPSLTAPPLSPAATPAYAGGTPTAVPSPPPVSTTALLARHEQLRQQELLLMALKQQQSTNRMLMLQQQRAMAGGGMGMGMGVGMGMGGGMGYAGDAGIQQGAQAYGNNGLSTGSSNYGSTLAQMQASQALQQRALAAQRPYAGLPAGAGTGLGGGMSAAAMQGMARLQAQGAYQQQQQVQQQQQGGGPGGMYGAQAVGMQQGGAAGMAGTGYGATTHGYQAGNTTTQQHLQQQQQQQQQLQHLQQQTAALQAMGANAQALAQQAKLPPGSPMAHMPQNAGQGQQHGLAATLGHVTDGPHGRTPEQLGLTVDDAGRPIIKAWDQLPPGYTSVVQFPYEVEPDSPCGGYTVYMHPPAGMAWPSKVPFFAPLLEPGIPFLKHGRTGFPHKRLLWMDISDAADPVLVWQEGAAPDPSRVKEKDKLRLIDILDIKAGRMSPVLQRSGNEAHAGRYMCFSSDGRTLDVEFASSEMRDWAFKKFAELFAAYAAAQVEKLKGDAITLRVLAIMDNGQDPKVRPQEPPKPAGVNPNLAARAASAMGGRPGGLPMPYGQGRPGMPGQAPYGTGGMPLNM